MTETATLSPCAAPAFPVLGVRVHATQIPGAIEQMEQWITLRDSIHYIAVTGMHGVMEAQQDIALKEILNSADLVVPDGMPLVWLGRRKGHGLKRRVYGPELMETFCRTTGGKYRHFLYGGVQGVAENLATVMETRFGNHVAGFYCPPFRPLTREEETAVERQIEAATPDILWVGLSTPKQEKWMYGMKGRLKVPVMVGVGAAFDFLTGRSKQAPEWMRENGLEWLYRLVSEPKRLWRRYILLGSKFVWNVSLEMLGLKQFN